MSLLTPDERRAYDQLVSDLATWIIDRTNGEPAAALMAVTEIAAEMIKSAHNPETCREHFIEGLDRFLKMPNRNIEHYDLSRRQ
jgi:hypothetical protein